jgi:hypothetical protein
MLLIQLGVCRPKLQTSPESESSSEVVVYSPSELAAKVRPARLQKKVYDTNISLAGAPGVAVPHPEAAAGPSTAQQQRGSTDQHSHLRTTPITASWFVPCHEALAHGITRATAVAAPAAACWCACANGCYFSTVCLRQCFSSAILSCVCYPAIVHCCLLPAVLPPASCAPVSQYGCYTKDTSPGCGAKATRGEPMGHAVKLALYVSLRVIPESKNQQQQQLPQPAAA